MKIKELECIKRMIRKGYYHDFAEWLVDTKFIIKDDLKALNRDLEKAEFIYKRLLELQESDDLQLLDFEWQLLPLEMIKITCTTHREEKQFIHGL